MFFFKQKTAEKMRISNWSSDVCASDLVNAVNAAARVVGYLADMAARKAAEGPFDSDFDVPHTTVHTGTIEGGTQLNIVPGHCRFEFEFRYLPPDDPAALLAEVQRSAETEVAPAMPAIDTAPGLAWAQIAGFPGPPPH